MIHHILIGWCTIHALIWVALAAAMFWVAHLLVQVRAERTRMPEVEQAPTRPLPSWALEETAAPAPSSGRHRRAASTGDTR